MCAPILHQLPRVAPRARVILAALALGLGHGACQTPQQAAAPVDGPDPGSPAALEAREEIQRMLDDWHAAAAEADAERYLGHMTPDASFLGTDATERWDRESFAAYVNVNFSSPRRGWTYLPKDRSIVLAPGGQVAWFDELLERGGFREVRGTGVVLYEEGRWMLAQYNMSYTVPNGVAIDVLSRILAFRRGEG